MSANQPRNFGCTNPLATNYQESATDDDDSCNYCSVNTTTCDWDCEKYWGVSCVSTPNDNGSCTWNYGQLCGCIDDAACNYDATNLEDDGSCTYDPGCGCGIPPAEEYYNCDGNCLTDTDGDDVCDELEILGCTNGSVANKTALLY